MSVLTMNNPNAGGCVFQHFGRIPEDAYSAQHLTCPLAQSVYQNDADQLRRLAADGRRVTGELSVGAMSCLEYAAMMGYEQVLRALIETSDNFTILQQYFSLNDITERAYMISSKKDIFFERGALVEANRYEAALYTAVLYNKPGCVTLLVTFIGQREPNRKKFYVSDTEQRELSPTELATQREHKACEDILKRHFLR